jgi:hypothetical protein
MTTMSDTTNKRRNFINDILAKIRPDNTSEVLGQLQSLLDKQGVERKELTSNTHILGAMIKAFQEKGVMEEVVADIDAALGKLTDNVPPEAAPEMLAIVMGKLMDVPMETPEEEVEVMADGEEEEEEPLPEAMMELTKQVNTLANDNTELVKDMNGMVAVMKEMAEGYAKVAPLVNKADEYAAMMNRVVLLEKAMSQSPRRASTAKETEVENADILSEMKQGTEGKKTLLGLPVKE